MTSASSLLSWSVIAAAALCGCGGVESPAVDAREVDAPGAALGTEANPAASCAELKVANAASGVYWVRHPNVASGPFQVYCEQTLNGGGWALLHNSVRTNGQTTQFWQFGFDDRLSRMGVMAPDKNFYDGSLYGLGREYMDIVTDLADKTAVAAVVATNGFNPATMTFIEPSLTIGNNTVFATHFAAGWSSQDHDGDLHPPSNCAVVYANVAQHYKDCWIYNLGADADVPFLDGAVGPHVHSMTLTALSLTLQVDGGTTAESTASRGSPAGDLRKQSECGRIRTWEWLGTDRSVARSGAAPRHHNATLKYQLTCSASAFPATSVISVVSVTR